MNIETIKEFGKHFWDWVDNRTVFRRSVVMFTLFMTIDTMIRAWDFAMASKLDGMSIAAIIAAIMVPLSAVQKFAFDLYGKARDGQ